MKCSILSAVKILLQLVLLLVFALVFGKPSVVQYLAKHVRTNRLQLATGGIWAPALTLAALGPQTRNGWRAAKGDAANSLELVQEYCGAERNIASCIQMNTFSQKETFKNVLLGYTTKTSLLSPSLTTPDFTASFYGQTYTLNVARKISPDDSTTQLFIYFDYSHDYVIFIHDPNYFLVNDNPYGLPSNMMKLYPNRTANRYHRLALVEKQELNVPADPCVQDAGYNFNTCIKQSLAARVGCRTKWDQRSSKNLPLCTTIGQYR